MYKNICNEIDMYGRSINSGNNKNMNIKYMTG